MCQRFVLWVGGVILNVKVDFSHSKVSPKSVDTFDVSTVDTSQKMRCVNARTGRSASEHKTCAIGTPQCARFVGSAKAPRSRLHPAEPANTTGAQRTDVSTAQHQSTTAQQHSTTGPPATTQQDNPRHTGCVLSAGIRALPFWQFIRGSSR